MTKKQQLKQFIREGAPVKEKIYRKPKVYLSKDKRNTDKNKFKESFGGEGV